jgi:hypothetical protein
MTAPTFLVMTESQRAIESTTLFVFHRSDPDVLKDKLLEMVPMSVRDLLGTEYLDVLDFAGLPEVLENHRKAGCYAGLSRGIIVNDEVAAAYVGSSSRKEGMEIRLGQHRASTLDILHHGRDAKKRSVFYTFAGRSEFRYSILPFSATRPKRFAR